MIKPKISIIMGIYNCEEYLEESIESILNQTFQDWELIMCDDGSTDQTYYIAKEYQKKYPDKIVLLKNDKNLGLNTTLNNCLAVAKGKYIARQDGDDISYSTRLQKEFEFLEANKKYAVVGTSMELFDRDGLWGELKAKENPDNKSFLKGTPFYHATCMIRTEVMHEVGGYTVDKRLLRVEDYHLWCKIYSKGYKGYNIVENLYRMRDGREATNRRTIKNRINEARVRYIGFKMLDISPKYYLYILRPLLLAILPLKLYEIIHRQRLSIGGKNK